MKHALLFSLLMFALNGRAQLIINEVLYDPSDSGLDGDANGDGVYDQEDDSFIEFVNIGPYDFDASGLQIWDDTTNGSLKYTVLPGTMVPPNGALVVFGGGTPTGTFGGALVQTASASLNGLNFNNSGEVIIIKDANGNAILSFDSDALSNNPNESYTRNPDITGLFEQHNDNTPLLFSPGLRTDGTPFDTVSVSPPVARNVQFRTDLSQLGIAVSQVFVSGDFNASCTNCDALTDLNGDGVWEGTVSVTSDSISYRIYADATPEDLSNAGSCANNASGTWLRTAYVVNDTVLPAYCWQSCSICLPLATAISVNGMGGQTSIATNGGTLQIEVVITPSNANQQVSWTVDDPSLAGISAQGLLTALANGTVRVTGATTDGSNLSAFVDINITNQSGIGLSELIDQELVLFPNPSQGSIGFQNLPEHSALRITDLAGRVLMEQPVETDRIELKGLPNGLYIMQLSGQGWSLARRMLIQH